MDIQPGACVNVDSQYCLVVALLPDEKFVDELGDVHDLSEIIEVIDGPHEKIVVDPAVFDALKESGLAAPSLDKMHVGDGIIIIDSEKASLKISVIAVMDRSRANVFARDGEFVEVNNPKFALSGWHTEKKNLLSDQGFAVVAVWY